ncbi:hypothetical protein F441_21812 [Phytophthora nicotianae CJ01A1]|uniref:Uncharacterized protein n=4 Tax=Phytophthora nicotianae TaxID=4792 RepID=V9DWH6_PHYNI|nr:hypothetical protein F443_21931 [Phytophthora nicotianae P1569]ETK71430.1 hypothetical protein L915_21327 [Phytophthora nicotianae]ETP00850.1 hypothetical protein F441_21812 [Phytophthora nicotianae CJ01A1]ETP28990.1 hypothetical protein F442_21793 [Phytophthora nicotianae P10297]ETL24872.1 hypothetical protein L916_21196 [Phytophthora nicotianae]
MEGPITAAKTKKQRKDEQQTICADELVRESDVRRASRAGSDVEDSNKCCSDAESIVSGVASMAVASSRSRRSTPRRVNAFQREVLRQEKRQRQEIMLKEQELQQSQQQFERRLNFERERDEKQLLFQERI